MSAIYPKFKDALVKRLLSGDLTGLNVKCVLIDTGVYTYSATHEFESDLSGIIGESPNLTSITCVDGVIDSANTTVTGVSGATVEAVAFFVDTGTPATSHLISFIDGLTLTPDGGNVDVTVNSIANL